LIYVDSSILTRALLPDEVGHQAARSVLDEAAGRLATWAMSQAEVASALRAAVAAGRLDHSAQGLLGDALFATHDAPLLLPGAPGSATALATAIASRQPVRAMDAIHIATAMTEARAVALGVAPVFVTGDNRQAEAARAEGLEVLVPA
jgi:predicted nucleic acid-binding protein